MARSSLVLRLTLMLLAVVVPIGLVMTSCSGATLHEDHDHGAEGLISTPDEAIDYNITFEGSNYFADRGGAVATDGKSLVIIKSGVYRLSGNYEGQLQVSVADTEHVTLILDEMNITCSDSAALYVKNAGCVYVEVPEGKTSTLTDAATYVYSIPGENKPNACIYAADDITFRGLGTLVVNGNYNNGIGCNNNISIHSGNITVTAINNGVKGDGSVTLAGSAKLDIRNAEDGIKSDGINAGEGIILIDGQAVASITCADDALQAVYSVTVTSDARVYYDCDGNIVNSDGITSVAEGVLLPRP